MNLSVIVPVYQVREWLCRSVESVLPQLGAEDELILVDDGSTDGSQNMVDAYARQDPRITAVHKPNGGLSSARNAGLDLARGSLVAFLDSDDYALPGWLEKSARAMENADLVVYNYCRVRGENREPPALPMKDEVLDLRKMGLARYLYRYWMPYVHGQEAWSRLYRRDLIERHHLRFYPNDEIFAEDTLFSAMYLLHVSTVAALSEPLICYEQREGSLMNAAKPYLAQRLIRLSSVLVSYVRSCGRLEEVNNVLPVLCYDKLIAKGLRLDADPEAAMEAMRSALGDEQIVWILRRLLSPGPLAAYTLNTGKGLRSQVNARLFAARWLHGDVRRAYGMIS